MPFRARLYESVRKSCRIILLIINLINAIFHIYVLLYTFLGMFYEGGYVNVNFYPKYFCIIQKYFRIFIVSSTYTIIYMVTVKIQIKNHLAEYIRGRFNDCNDGPVSFPDHSDLYVQIWDLLSKRPVNAQIDQGNLEINLPKRSFGKNPDYYNYLSERSVKLLSKSIEALMYCDLHDRIRQRQNERHPLEIRNIKETIYEFLEEYGIYSISHDAFYKEYYRMRDKERYRRKMMKKGINI